MLGVNANHHFRSCAGFSDACITNPSTHSGSRRRRSAKARNRGQEGVWVRRCDLWGFAACGRLLSSRRKGVFHALLTTLKQKARQDGVPIIATIIGFENVAAKAAFANEQGRPVSVVFEHDV